MPREVQRIYDIGTDVYGRQVQATRHVDYMGRRMWKIVSHPVSNQDEGERMDGLSDENLRELIQCVQTAK